MIDLRHLRIVDAIARAGSVTGAARSLYLTQPAVSHALRDLEERLEVPLFQRLPRGMALTTEGERLLRTAERVLDDIAEAEHDLRRFRDGVKGIVRIATECYTCYHWLPPILGRFSAEFPDVEIRVEPRATRDPIAGLTAHTLDLAVVHSHTEDPAVAYDELFEDELVAAVAPSHPLAGASWLTPEDFADEALLLHSDPEESVVVREFLAPAGVRPARVAALQLTEAVVGMVEANLGVSVLSRWALEPQLAAGSIAAVRLGRSGLYRRWYAATRGRERRGKAIERLLEGLRASRLASDRGQSPPAAGLSQAGV